jgi:hypothetical protein
MKTNMGTADRIIRSLLALAIVGLYATGAIGGTLAIILGVVAAVLLLTSLVGVCPAYLPFGVSTCRRPEGSR